MSSPEWAQFVRLASDSAAEKENFISTVSDLKATAYDLLLLINDVLLLKLMLKCTSFDELSFL